MAATLLNLGLAAREATGPAPQEGVACCELGVTHLLGGSPAEAVPLLGEALQRAVDRGDEVGAGQAANALGLARLALGEPRDAAEAFAQAAAAHPRSMRPAEFAMAKANLALACEQGGDAPRARLAAVVLVVLPLVVSLAHGIVRAARQVREYGRDVDERVGLALDALRPLHELERTRALAADLHDGCARLAAQLPPARQPEGGAG